jgi:hypothetical protein
MPEHEARLMIEPIVGMPGSVDNVAANQNADLLLTEPDNLITAFNDVLWINRKFR